MNNNSKRKVFTFLLLVLFSLLFASSLFARTDTLINSKVNCSYYNDCAGAAIQKDLNNAALAKMAGILVLLILGTLYFYNKNKKVISLIIGGGLSLVIVLATILPSYINKKPLERPCEKITTTACFKADSSKTDEFVAAGSEFAASTETADEFSSNVSEFKSESYSVKPALAKDSVDEFSAPADEFSASGNEFAKQTTSDKNDLTKSGKSKSGFALIFDNEYQLLYEILVLFLLIVAIGLLLRYPWFRNLRGYFLLASVIYLGFVRGGCPCMIMSMQNFVLFIIGFQVSLVAMLWFLGLIPLTYFFGKVWCGWLCHLGALQELIFLPEKIKVLKTKKAQKWLRGIRIFFLLALLVQIAVMQTNYFVKIDPFKVAFNLFSANITGYVLLALVLITSVFIYRPFCRAVCPVGLILGWVAKVPHAQTITKELSCIHCVTCSKDCLQHSMIHEQKKTYLSEQDCIFCGKCMGSCKKKFLNIKKRAIL